MFCACVPVLNILCFPAQQQQKNHHQKGNDHENLHFTHKRNNNTWRIAANTGEGRSQCLYFPPYGGCLPFDGKQRECLKKVQSNNTDKIKDISLMLGKEETKLSLRGKQGPGC